MYQNNIRAVMRPPVILVIDDDPALSTLYGRILSRDYEVHTYTNFEALQKKLSQECPDLLITDLEMPGMSGLEVIAYAKKKYPDVPVLVVSGKDDPYTVSSCFKQGAADFLPKPVTPDALRKWVGDILQRYGFRERRLEKSSEARFVGNSPAVKHVREQIKRVADSDVVVLLHGETGTGKNLVARMIHEASSRRNNRFIEINCAALPDTLLEAELFGYEKGAFTDAHTTKPGLLEAASGGTVLLDEIDSLPPGLQSKLLHFIETRKFRRLGSVKDQVADVRLICATNVSLEKLVEEGRFRKDLYFRLSVFIIDLPPLKAIPEDIGPIAEHLLDDLSRKHNRRCRLAPQTIALLSAHDWPGNVRELRNVLERALICHGGDTILPEHIELRRKRAKVEELIGQGAFCFPLGRTLDELEKAYILQTARVFRNIPYRQMAKMLGICNRTLIRKRRIYGLEEELTKIRGSNGCATAHKNGMEGHKISPSEASASAA